MISRAFLVFGAPSSGSPLSELAGQSPKGKGAIGSVPLAAKQCAHPADPGILILANGPREHDFRSPKASHRWVGVHGGHHPVVATEGVPSLGASGRTASAVLRRLQQPTGRTASAVRRKTGLQVAYDSLYYLKR